MININATPATHRPTISPVYKVYVVGSTYYGYDDGWKLFLYKTGAERRETFPICIDDVNEFDNFVKVDSA